jgi:hypothetical protein
MKFSGIPTIAHLRARANAMHMRIPGKCRLKEDIRRFMACVYLQRWWRGRREYRKMTKPITCNEIDPFSLEKIEEQKDALFCQFESETVMWKFQPEVLYNYFLESGNFKNPFNRNEFNYIELKRLYKQLCKKYPHRKFFPIHVEYRNINIERRAQEQRRQTIQLLTNEAYALLEHLWRPLNSPPLTGFRTILDQSFVLCHEQIPSFVRHIEYIQRLDNDSAYTIVQSTILALRGICLNPLITPLYPVDQVHCAGLANQILSQHFGHLRI